MYSYIYTCDCVPLHYDPASYSSWARLRSFGPEPKRKRVLIGRTPQRKLGKSMGVDPKPKRSIQGQVEARVTPSGGPNPFMLKNVGMSSG